MSSFAKGALSHLSDFGGIDGGICMAIQKVDKVNQHVIGSLYFPPPLPGALYYYSEAGPKFGSCLGEHFPFVLGQ